MQMYLCMYMTSPVSGDPVGDQTNKYKLQIEIPVVQGEGDWDARLKTYASVCPAGAGSRDAEDDV